MEETLYCPVVRGRGTKKNRWTKKGLKYICSDGRDTPLPPGIRERWTKKIDRRKNGLKIYLFIIRYIDID
jgi:hypothetical protein